MRFLVHIASLCICGSHIYFKTYEDHSVITSEDFGIRAGNFACRYWPIGFNQRTCVVLYFCTSQLRFQLLLSTELLKLYVKHLDSCMYDRTIGVWSPAEATVSSPALGPPSLCTMCTGGPFPGAKARLGLDTDHSPHLVPRSWMSRSYTSSPPCASIGVLWDCLAFLCTTCNGLYKMEVNWNPKNTTLHHYKDQLVDAD
jgi:hypothetical protein